MMKKSLIVIMLSLNLFSCGGADGDSNSGSPSNPGQSKSSASVSSASNGKASGAVELGPVRGASVAIQSLDGITFATAITDGKGYFSVDAAALKNEINKSDTETKFVKIVSTGGVDTDPNDDGVFIASEELPVKGNVSGIVPVDTIYKSKEYRINFISTALSDILDGEKSISAEQIAYIVQRLGIHDLNNDGKIDIDDLTSYNMAKDNSLAETSLRQGYLSYIHAGDQEAKKLFIDNLKYEVGFAKPVYVKKNGYYSVNFSKTSINNTIYYGVASVDISPNFDLYNGGEIQVNFGEILFYQECSEDFGCYKLQKLFVYENVVYQDFDGEQVKDNFNEVVKIQEQLQTVRDKKSEHESNVVDLNKKLSEVDKKIIDLNGKINSI